MARGHQEYRILILILYILCKLSILTFSQAPRNYAPPSPTAASLGLFGQIPVSEYSGVPNISVPIYTIQEQQFQLPINLSYHSTGIKVTDNASWVGMNWALNAGGVITRTKRHLDDFSGNGFYKQSANWPCDDNHDQEPDIFYFNFGTGAGKFIIDKPTNGNQYTIRSFAKSNVRIELKITDNTWIITASDGVKYKFEKKEFTEDYNVSNGNTINFGAYVSSWYLTSIELLTGNSILFEYETSSSRIKRTYNTVSTKEFVSYSPSYINCCLPATSFPQNEVNTLSSYTTLTDEVVQKKIIFSQGYIEFITSTRTDLTFVQSSFLGRKLEKINLFSSNPGTGNLLKTFEFTYDYYNGSAGKLRLRKVQERSITDNKPAFEFLYNSDNLFNVAHLGGFQSSAEKGLLKTITYPTGGVSEFEFESNKYADAGTGAVMNGGGARIKRHISKNGVDNSSLMRFEYEGGKLMGEARMEMGTHYSTFFPITSTCCGVYASQTSPITAVFYFRETIRTDFSSLGETFSGTIVGYDKVTVYTGENGEGGKKISFFNNEAPVIPTYQQGAMPISVPVNVSGLNGVPKDEFYYGYSNPSFRLVKHNHYEFELSDVQIINAKRRAYNKCNEFSYQVKTDWTRLKSQIVETYDESGANPMIQEFTYGYGADNVNPKSIKTIDSKGDQILIENKYAQDKSVVLGGIYTTMVEKNLFDQTIEVVRKRNGVQTEKYNTFYKDWYGDGKVIAPEYEEYQQGVSDPIVKKVVFDGFDIYGNPFQYKGKDGIINSFQWFASKQYPLVKAINAKNKMVYQSGISSNSSYFYIGGSVVNSYGSQTSFTQINSGSISLSLPVSPPSGASVSIFYQLTGPAVRTGTICRAGYGSSGCVSSASSVTFSNMPPGIYSLSYTASTSFSSYQFSSSFSWSYTSVTAQVYEKEFYYEGFEDITGAATAFPYCGKKYYLGDYQVSYATPNSRLYKINYHYLEGGVWKNMIKDYNNGTMMLAEGDAIDEIRIFPTDAQITTYTYDPLIGLTSETDPNGNSIFYEYDDLLQLRRIRDKDRKIIKEFEYKYQFPPCKADWQNTSAAARCKKVNGQNTGELEQEQSDVNTCSPTYNTTRWVVTGTNTSLCPLPAQTGCSFTMYSGFSTPTNNISASGNSVSFYLAFNSASTTLIQGNDYMVASINGGCRPSTNRSFTCNAGGRVWLVNVYSSGQVSVRITSGGNLPAATTTSITGSYNL